MDRRTANVKPATARAKARRGEALLLTELAVVSGYPYSVIWRLSREPDFPRFQGRVTVARFDAWIDLQIERQTKRRLGKGIQNRNFINDNEHTTLTSR